jgi:retron-type reverse transcriptase
MRKNLVRYLEENNLLSNKQHGFRKGRSCLTQLLKHYDAILNNYLNDTETDVIYLDFAKAFDKVDHSLLLKKVRYYGIGGKVYDWIEQFLLGRTQTVVVDGHHSLPFPVISGVPQGTVLGPILFLMYINDLETTIKDSTASSFADDTRISRQIELTQDTEKLQYDLNNVIEWSKSNNMELHEQKFEFLSYRLPANAALCKVLPFQDTLTEYTTPSGTVIERKSSVRDLGVLVSDGFTWTPHVNKMVNDARKMASWTLGVFRDRSKVVMLQLYKSLIRSKLEYCCPLWNPSLVQDIQTIEDVQRYFTNRISGMSDLSYWERLSALKLQSLQRRRERYIIIHTWKTIVGYVPNDLNMQFVVNKRYGLQVAVPALNKTASAKAKTCYDRSFHTKAAQLWNLLPADAKDFQSLDRFKVSLSTFLRKFPDKPPVTGYSTANHNSLLDWSNQSGGLQMM